MSIYKWGQQITLNRTAGPKGLDWWKVAFEKAGCSATICEHPDGKYLKVEDRAYDPPQIGKMRNIDTLSVNLRIKERRGRYDSDPRLYGDSEVMAALSLAVPDLK